MAQNKSDSEREESYYEEISQNTESKGPSKSFVWDYFRREGIKSTCEVKLDDSEECGVSYFDGSTTSNLINHLTQLKRNMNLYNKNLLSFIIDDSQPFNIIECRSFQKLLHSLDENFSIPCILFKGGIIKNPRFPILSKIARKYLCVSATSVSSEWLFSDVGKKYHGKTHKT
ncbi:24085_t:CDS:2 [Gigaspora margarita]|uniref:24085_t:CDS:1 n=1 Tax=Gigaspora margarita TaxID=4874 RepID=A0ABM8W0N1_GIGMA|nr:24085_t:CDS:2 [Gigaspora margarita]